MVTGNGAFLCLSPFTMKQSEMKRKRNSEGGRWRQSDVAGRLKCSSRDLTLEFAGNHTGLRGPGVGWGGVGWVGGIVCTSVQQVCMYLYTSPVSFSVWAVGQI